MENKRCSSASQLGNAFVELFVDHPVPDTTLDSFLVRTLRHLAGDVIHLATDVLSSEREARFDPIPNGLSTLRQALDSTCATGEHPRHLPVVRSYLDDLLYWMGGNMQWTASTRRYDPAYDGDSLPA